MIINFSLWFIPIAVVLLSLRKYRERKWGRCKNNVKLDGKTAIVTGANCGIGYEIAKELASRNAQVILACRNLESAKRAALRIEKDLERSVVLVTMELDLSSLLNIRNFVESVQRHYLDVDFLINNAGVSYPKNEMKLTKDGVEAHFGVNHLGHFYLTKLLLSSIKEGGRIVVITSSLHERGKIDFDNLNEVSPGHNSNLYANSKLANVYFCQELARTLRDSNVNVYGVCPGWVYTSLFRHSIKWYHYILVAPIAFFFMRSPRQGAQTPVYCVTEPKLECESGLLYRNCMKYNSKYHFNDETRTKLWKVSEDLVDEILNKRNL